MSRRRLSDAPVLWRLDAGARPDGPHIAVVPGALAPLLPVDLPEGLRGLARERVAGRQLAEALAMPLETIDLHPFTPSGKKTPFTHMLAVGTQQAEDWRAALHPGCLALLPDYLALPCIAEVWTVDTSASGGVAVRLGQRDGFTAEPDLAVRLMGDAEPPRAILRLGPPHSGIDTFLATKDVPLFDDLATLARSGVGKPLRWSVAAGGVDLATAPSAMYDRLGQGLARWRWPVLVATLALVAWLGALMLETRAFENQASRASALTRDLVRQNFVPEGPILNVRAQVQTAFNAAAVPDIANHDTPPLIQLQRAAPVLTRDGVTLQSAEYRASTGLVTAVSAVDFAGLDALVGDLRGSGFLVEVLDSRAQASGGIAARLRLQAAPQ